MGSTATLANAALRDYVVAGDPASGANNPVKADVRGAFTDADTRLGTLETSDGAQSTTLGAHTTELGNHEGRIGTLESSDGTQNTTLGGHTIELANHEGRIGTLETSDGTQNTTLGAHTTELANHNSHLTGIDVEITALNTTALDSSNSIATINSTLSVTKDRMPIGRAIATRQRLTPSGNWYPASTFLWWAIGVSVTHAVPLLDHITFFPAEYSTVSQFVLDIYSRPLTSGDTGQPPQAPADTLITSLTYNIADLIRADGERTTAKAMDFPINFPVSMDLSHIYWFKLSAKDSLGAVANFGMANGQYDTPSPIWARGWFAQSIGGTPTASALASPSGLPFELYEAVGTPIDDTRWLNGGPDEPTGVGPLTAHQSGLIAAFPELVLDRAQGPLHIAPFALTFTAPATDIVSGETTTIYYNLGQNFQHQFIGAGTVVVRKVSDSSLLTEGVDYSVDYDEGQITGINSANTAGIPVTMSYTGYRSRYDMVVADAFTGALSIVAGTDRGTDPNEYAPLAVGTSYTGKVPLYSVFVTVNKGVDIIPIHQFNGPRRNKDRGRYVDWIETCRHRLPRLMKKMRTGAAIKLAGYGDSITDMGGGAPAGGGGTYDWYTPDGQYRDTNIFFFTGKLASDTIAAIPLFDHGDGGGTIHHHLGWNWALKKAIESRSGCTVTYNNMGIGGSTSDGAMVNGVPGGFYSTRFSALTALAPDLVVLEFGMNELGSIFTYSNIVAMTNLLKTICDVIIMGVPAVAKDGPMGPMLDQWRYTNNELLRAAEYTQTAYVPLMEICDPANVGGLGISWQTMAETNGVNHPGPYELGKYGDFLARIVP